MKKLISIIIILNMLSLSIAHSAPLNNQNDNESKDTANFTATNDFEDLSSQAVEIGNYDSQIVTVSDESILQVNDEQEELSEIAPESDFEINEFGYITKYRGTSENINIPPVIKGIPVKGIGKKSFCYCRKIKNIILPEDIISIENYAFYDCENLTSIKIPNNVSNIGDYAFHGCKSLTNIKLPNNLTNIGNFTFYYCTALSNIEIPNGVANIGNKAFHNCNNLITINIPNSIINISNDAFSGCSKLNSINVAENNTMYTSINGILFNKTKTILLTCPEGLSNSYIIPDSVVSIGDYAFAGCLNLTSIRIPSSVISIGNYAFSSCQNITNIDIPSEVTKMGTNVFSNCYHLTNIDIPNNIDNIGDHMFSNCIRLTNVKIPDSVTNIGDYAFYDCNALTDIKIPDSVTNIGDYAFYDCNALTDIEIPAGVINIGNKAFSDCDILNSINVNENNTIYTSINGVLFNKTKTTILSYPKGSNNSYIIPDSVTSIGDYAFFDCRNLTNIKIPDSVTNIGECAFYNCHISVIEIPANVISIGNRAFVSSSGYAFFSGDAPTAFGKNVFDYVDGIETPFVPIDPDPENTVIYPSGGPIYKSSCKVYYNEGAKGFTTPIWNGYDTIMISDFSESEEDFEIDNNGVITKYNGTCRNVNIPPIIKNISVTEIGEKAFYNCKSLTSIEIPDGVISIGNDAFSECFNLTSIEIPNSVQSIGWRAFEDCENLKSAYFKGNAPSEFGNNVFKGTANDFTIYYYVGAEGFTTPTWNGYNTVELKNTEITGMSSAGDVVYNGKPQTGYVGTPVSEYKGAYEFIYSGRNSTEYNSSSAPVNAGDYTVTIKIPKEQEYIGSVSFDFSILKSEIEFKDGIKLYNNNQETNEFSYGDLIVAKVKPQAAETAKAILSIAEYDEPVEKQMALYIGNKQVSEAVWSEQGTYTMTVDSKDESFVIGVNTITAKYVGDDNMADYQESVSFTLKNNLEIKGITAENSVYDGNPHKGYISEPINEEYTGDYEVNYSGRNGTEYNSKEPPVNTGDYVVTFKIPDNENYTGSASLDFSILKSEIEFKNGVKLYNNNRETNEFSYGDLIVAKVKPQMKETEISLAEFTEPEEKQMAMYIGDNQISDAVNPDVDGVYTLTSDTKNENFVIGTNIITIKYVGDNNMADYQENVEINLKKKNIEISGITAENAVYDGNPHKGYISEPTNDEYTGDYKIEYSGRNGTEYNSKEPPVDAGDYVVTIKTPSSENYIGSVSLNFSIMEKTDISNIKAGDIDLKGGITVNDAALLLQKVLGMGIKLPIEEETDNYMEYVDVNGDGILTATDVAMILQKALHENFVFPIEVKK